MLLEIKGLNFNYPDKEIFQSFDLKALPGKILHLNGPSGAGKTTLLHLIAGIQSPQSGVITLGEEVFYNKKQKLLIEERGVGLVFQDYALFPHLNVINNITFGNKNITEKKLIKLCINWTFMSSKINIQKKYLAVSNSELPLPEQYFINRIF
jgi:iron(III) transport system ATP-binding protein